MIMGKISVFIKTFEKNNELKKQFYRANIYLNQAFIWGLAFNWKNTI